MNADRGPRWTITSAALAVAGGLLLAQVVAAIAGQLSHLAILLLVSLVLGCALEPVAGKLIKRGWSRGLATSVVLFGGLIALVAVTVAVSAAVVGQIADAASSAPRLVSDIASMASNIGIHLDQSSLAQWLSNGLDSLASLARKRAGDAAAGVAGVVFDVATVALVVFYLVADGPKLRRLVCSLLPPARQRVVLRSWEIALDKAGSYLTTRMMLALVSASVATVAMLIAGVPYAFALGAWVGLMSQLIPVIGTYLAAALPLLVAVTVSPTRMLLILVVLVAYQQVENYLVAPWLTRRSLKVHPAVGLLSVIGGTAVLGPAGALVALPVVATVQALAEVYVHRHELIEDDLLHTGEIPAVTVEAAPAMVLVPADLLPSLTQQFGAQPVAPAKAAPGE